MPEHEEQHVKTGDLFRDFVFGFGDGINTSLGIVSGVGGANVSNIIIVLAGVVGMFTGAKAMAVQNYLAVKSQKEVLEAEIQRERFEMENLPEVEKKEIEDIYREKGFDGGLLKNIVETITSDKTRWLRTMLIEELGLNPEYLGSPLKSAFVMFFAFLIGGILPIIPYLITNVATALFISIGVSLIASFLVGAFKTRFTGRNWVKSGLEMTLLGTGIALVGYGIGKAFIVF
jgi:predicted membrane protein (TIGR00267 family)